MLPKIFSVLIVPFIIIFSGAVSFCQLPPIHTEKGDLLKFVDGPTLSNSYSADSAGQEFYERNQLKIEQIRDSLENFPIDRCHHGLITLHLAVDTSGTLTNAEILNGSSVPKIDSLIKVLVQNLHGNWIPATEKNIPKPFNGLLSYKLINAKETRRTKRETTTLWNGYVRSIEMTKKLDVSKNCEDNDFFYEAGLTEFNNNNFKRAIYNFKNAHEANPFDLDVIFNIAISYLKMDDRKNACKFFLTGAGYGDSAAEKKYKSFCSEDQK